MIRHGALRILPRKRARTSIEPLARALLSVPAIRPTFSLSRSLHQSSVRHFASVVEDVPEQLEGVPEGENVEDEVDVCIVGGGPAGLSAAIRLKQLAEEQGREIRVVLLEKGGEMGSHVLSGAVIEPRSLDELLPNWREMGAPIYTEATSDTMRFLTATSDYPMPHPPQMNNKGNYIISLSQLSRWLAEQAEAMGVEVYPGFAGAQLLYGKNEAGEDAVVGVRTNDIGLDKQYKPKEAYEPGMDFKARVTLLAEGAAGSLSKQAIGKFDLRKNSEPQTYGLGVKEVWRIDPAKHQPGKVVHTLGWPLFQEYGGSWLYHLTNENGDPLVSLGLVVGLDYKNPYLSPYREFQRMKHHPFFADLLEGGECIAYGARALNEGGFQSIPKLDFPGGALVGCSAGFLNVPKIKGIHTAMQSGMVAAKTAFETISAKEEDSPVEPISMQGYQTAMENSWVWKELHQVRNMRPSFHTWLGNIGGILYSGIEAYIFRGKMPWTLHHPGEDYAQTATADNYKPIEYPSPDGKLSFDILTSVSRTGTNHTENQPVHLVVKDSDHARHVKESFAPYGGGILNRACPAGVYEYIDVNEDGGIEDADGRKFVINSQNCIHCKTCSIKAPMNDIEWNVPEGGGGPSYSVT